MATENEITIESRPTLAERVAARAAELERQGWTRAAADGLAKDGLAKEGGKEPRGKMKLELTRLAAFAKVAQSKGELKQ